MSSSTVRNRPDLSALIGSRICHDLISPIGAIGNGVELLTMSGNGLGPEMSLVAESVANANVRIRFFRIAFGLASEGQGIGRSEIRSIMADMYGKGRLKAEWSPEVDCRRDEAKAVFLAMMCLETAMPYGGTIRVSRTPGDWRVEGLAEKLKLDPAPWALLEGNAQADVTPALVQFLLLPEAVDRLARRLTVEKAADRIVLRF